MTEAALTSVDQEIATLGWGKMGAKAVRQAIGPLVPSQWAAFRQSWDRLGTDLFMADGGRYRRRRHAVFDLTDNALTLLEPQPHYQSRDYNALNGGIARWFEQVEPQIAKSDVLGRLLDLCVRLSGAGKGAWIVELHQFRIEAGEVAGLPTPEGMHRDGVDFVGIFLMDRRNVTAGTTCISIDGGAEIAEFTLAEPLDAVFVDDRRVFHGVTPISRIDPDRPAWRDVLVCTFKQSASTPPHR